MSALEHCCAFCGSVMRLLLLPAADGSGKILCCWGCEAAGRMDHVCWTDDILCSDCGGTVASATAAVCRLCQSARHAADWQAVVGAGSRG